jgi:hypothetical protein
VALWLRDKHRGTLTLAYAWTQAAVAASPAPKARTKFAALAVVAANWDRVCIYGRGIAPAE